MKSIRKLDGFLHCLKNKNISLLDFGYLVTNKTLDTKLTSTYSQLVADYRNEPLDIDKLKGYASIFTQKEPTIDDIILAKIVLDLEELENFIRLKENILSNSQSVLLKFPKLKKHLTEENLFSIDPFKILSDALQYENSVLYTKLPYPLVYNFMNYCNTNQKGNKIAISLSPKIITRDNYKTFLLEERLYGRPFSISNLKSLMKKKEYGEFKYYPSGKKEIALSKAFYVPVLRLEYVFNPKYREHKISLSIAELIDIQQIDNGRLNEFVYHDYENNCFLIKTRFLHSVFNATTEKFEHLDCSYHIYASNNYKIRLQQHLKNKTINADYRTKLFRIDGEIEYRNWVNFAAVFFYKNPLISEFICGK